MPLGFRRSCNVCSTCSVAVDRPPVHTECSVAVDWPQCVVSGRFCARKLPCLLTGVTLAKSEWHNLLFQLRPLMSFGPAVCSECNVLIG